MTCKTCQSIFTSTQRLMRCPNCGRINGEYDGSLIVPIAKIKTKKQVVRSKNADIQTDENTLPEQTLEQ